MSSSAMPPSLDTTLHILIVDDDAVDRMALDRALHKTAFDTVISEATDADEALDAIASEHYDCIFLDYNLPGRNGLELTRAIRNQDIRVPLIVLTGQGNEETAAELIKAGASDYLPKSKLSVETITRSMRSSFRVFQAEQIANRANQDLLEKNKLLEKTNNELEQQRQQIYKQNLQLQEVSRLKSEFLATMSHELRTPLNAIIGFSQILLNQGKGPLNGKQQDMLGRVLANGRNLLVLINDILAFSKAEAGRLALEPVETDLSSLVEKTVEEIHSLAAQKSLTLTSEISLQNPIVCNDPTRLRQIIVNLLSNAIKFTETGSVTVTVSDQLPSAESSHEILLSVSDTGCGISLEHQVNIFDPFHQADQRTTRKHDGTGLGLAITYSLVKMMQGDITIDSRVGHGTTFLIALPREVQPRNL
ncbi:MAG: ATP-binding protein [Cyanobacteria bacterium J06627_28]